MFGIGFGEIIIIALLALILFGQKDLPSNIRKAANGLKEFRKFSGDIQRSWHEVRGDVTRTLLEESKKEEVKHLPSSSEGGEDLENEHVLNPTPLPEIKKPEGIVSRGDIRDEKDV